MTSGGDTTTHIGGRATGWLATATFVTGGARPPQDNLNSVLTVHAINPERGSGTSLRARGELLKRAVVQGGQVANTVYLTSAGFFGCVSPAGNSSRGLKWPGIDQRTEARLLARLGGFAHSLNPDVWLAIGVDLSGETHTKQELWWFRGGSEELQHKDVRGVTPADDRMVAIGPFNIKAFICGGIFGYHGVEPLIPEDLAGVDVVLDAAHASMNRKRDAEADENTLYPRWAFQRTICRLGDHCGAVFAQARGADASLVRNCDNWIVYRGERPFADPALGRRLA